MMRVLISISHATVNGSSLVLVGSIEGDADTSMLVPDALVLISDGAEVLDSPRVNDSLVDTLPVQGEHESHDHAIPERDPSTVVRW